MVPPEALTQDEIDSLLTSLSGGGAADVSATTSSAESKTGATFVGNQSLDTPNYKVYNFRRPDKFSKDQLRALQGLHQNFCRQLSMAWTGFLRMGIEIEVVSVDQLTYDEIVRSMPSPITVNIIELAPLPGQCLLGYSHEVTSAIIDRMLGGLGKVEVTPRTLTDIETALLKRCFEQSLEHLEQAWQSVTPIKINSVGMEDSYSLIQVATSSEMVAFVTFQVNIGQSEAGLMSLSIPYPVLENILPKLSAQHIFLGKENQNMVDHVDDILHRLHYAHVPVKAFLGGVSMSVEELLSLNTGDVVCLEKKAVEDILIEVNGKPKFMGRPGLMGKHLAVSVTENVENEDKLEGFGL